MRKKSILSTLSVILVALVVLFSFPITAGASDTITDLKIEPITVIEGTNGITDCNENFFEYTLEDKINYTVTFADGEVVSGSGYMFEHNDVHYNFEIETDQSKNNIWTAGNTYTATVSISGKSVDVPVFIEETPIESIYVEPMYFNEYTGGEWVTYFDNESGKFQKDYYFYNFSEKVTGTVTFKDGTTATLGESVEYNGEKYWYSVTDDQSSGNEWEAGEFHYGELELMGAKAQVPVYIKDSHITSIEVEPIQVTENTSGEWGERRNHIFFTYKLYNLLNYTVTFDDGEVITGTGEYVPVGDDYYTIKVTTDQSYLNEWTAGNTYGFEVELAGCISHSTAEILPNEVQSVEIEPVEIFENTKGVLTTVEDEEGVIIDEYYAYNPLSSIKYTVTYKDGSIVTGVGPSENVELNIFADQTYHNQWTVGNTYEIIVSIDGFVTTADVSIVECPIESIEMKPITIVEGSNFEECYDYDYETDEYYNEYLHYYPDELMEYTICFKDGTVIQGSDYLFEYKGFEYSVFATTDQSYENQWTAGNTYNYTVRAIGFESQGEVTIEKAQKGDANLDGDVDIMDATYIQMYLAQHIEITSFEWRISDVNDDYDVNIMDVTHIQRESAKLS